MFEKQRDPRLSIFRLLSSFLRNYGNFFPMWLLIHLQPAISKLTSWQNWMLTLKQMGKIHTWTCLNMDNYDYSLHLQWQWNMWFLQKIEWANKLSSMQCVTLGMFSSFLLVTDKSKPKKAYNLCSMLDMPILPRFQIPFLLKNFHGSNLHSRGKWLLLVG